MLNKKEAKRVSPHYNFFPKNRRGQGLSTNAIILIVLGVIVLVILAIGFYAGWGKIAPWINPDNNVKDIVQACNMACATESVYDFCTVERELKDIEGKSAKENCAIFSTINDYGKYGVQKCHSINCEIQCDQIKIGTRTAVENKGLCDDSSQDDVTSIAKISTSGMDHCCIDKQ